MKTIKLGLIGAGGISQAHCRTIASIDGAEFIAVSDLVVANVERAKERWGIENTFTDYNEMLKMDELDAVFVCTPTGVHAPPTVAALKAGKHVLCEKPMEATLDAATEMVGTAHETGKILMVALKLRYSPQVIKAKAIIDAGTLGDIYYAETVADRRRGNPGGSFIRKATAGLGASADIGVYALDTALHLMEHPKPIAVSGITSNYLSLHNTWNPAQGCRFSPQEPIKDRTGGALQEKESCAKDAEFHMTRHKIELVPWEEQNTYLETHMEWEVVGTGHIE